MNSNVTLHDNAVVPGQVLIAKAPISCFKVSNVHNRINVHIQPNDVLIVKSVDDTCERVCYVTELGELCEIYWYCSPSKLHPIYLYFDVMVNA